MAVELKYQQCFSSIAYPTFKTNKQIFLTTRASCSAAALRPGSMASSCQQSCAQLQPVGTGRARARMGAASTAETAESHSAAPYKIEAPTQKNALSITPGVVSYTKISEAR